MELSSSGTDQQGGEPPSSKTLKNKDEVQKGPLELTISTRVAKSALSDELLPPHFIHPPHTMPSFSLDEQPLPSRVTAAVEVQRIFIPKASLQIALDSIKAKVKAQEGLTAKPAVSLN